MARHRSCRRESFVCGPKISKNKDGRLLPLSGELLEIMERAHEKRRLDCPFVFHDDGEPIGDFRKAWSNACKAAGLSPNPRSRPPSHRRAQHGACRHSGTRRDDALAVTRRAASSTDTTS